MWLAIRSASGTRRLIEAGGAVKGMEQDRSPLGGTLSASVARVGVGDPVVRDVQLHPDEAGLSGGGAAVQCILGAGADRRVAPAVSAAARRLPVRCWPRSRGAAPAVADEAISILPVHQAERLGAADASSSHRGRRARVDDHSSLRHGACRHAARRRVPGVRPCGVAAIVAQALRMAAAGWPSSCWLAALRHCPGASGCSCDAGGPILLPFLSSMVAGNRPGRSDRFSGARGDRRLCATGR